MNILGIETSCDETAAAVVKDGTKILSNVIASSSEMHAKTGGIMPEQAARAQIQSIIPVIEKAIADSLQSSAFSNKKAVGQRQLAVDHVDAIAVTAGGPGLIGSMLVGVETAKTLSYLWKKPIVPVVHLFAHVYANWLTENSKPKFPAIVLTVSGGHSDILLMSKHGKFEWIGGTRDDAAGETFDKCARLLGLPYPGGPSIAKEAARFQLPSSSSPLKLFPRPMIDSDNFDFSFSGLKTSVLNRLTDNPVNKSSLPKYAAEIQEAIVDSLVAKSVRAIEKYKPISFLLAGGVAANNRLREKLRTAIQNQKDLEFHVPPIPLCTDNATFIASYAFFNYTPMLWNSIRAITDPFEAAVFYGNIKG